MECNSCYMEENRLNEVEMSTAEEYDIWWICDGCLKGMKEDKEFAIKNGHSSLPMYTGRFHFSRETGKIRKRIRGK